MNTFIISSKYLEKSREEIDRIIELNKINKFDIELIEPEENLGIEDVRNIQKKVFLKPFRGEKKAVIINVIQGVSDEAQNAMLKLLEEPPANTLIFLITKSPHIFFPTILSRAKLIELDKGSAPEIDKKYFDILKNLRESSVGYQLKLAQDISKDKNEAIVWLEEVILAVRGQMLKNLEDKQEALMLRKLIHSLELTHYDLKTTNVNPRLALENLFLNI